MYAYVRSYQFLVFDLFAHLWTWIRTSGPSYYPIHGILPHSRHYLIHSMLQHSRHLLNSNMILRQYNSCIIAVMPWVVTTLRNVCITTLDDPQIWKYHRLKLTVLRFKCPPISTTPIMVYNTSYGIEHLRLTTLLLHMA